jgi:serine O-acetyltransferase
VVLKNVPEGVTVVGIPAHVVDNKAKKEIADKIGFNAYGMTADMSDPIAHAINRMLDHIQVLDKQVMTLQAALHTAGISDTETPINPLDDCEIADGCEPDV